MKTFEKIRTLWTQPKFSRPIVVRPLRSSVRLAPRAAELTDRILESLQEAGVQATVSGSNVVSIAPETLVFEGAVEHLSGELVLTFTLSERSTRQLRVSAQVHAPESSEDGSEVLAQALVRQLTRPLVERPGSKTRLSA